YVRDVAPELDRDPADAGAAAEPRSRRAVGAADAPDLAAPTRPERLLGAPLHRGHGGPRLQRAWMSGRLRVVTWNVNGLRACARKGFCDWLARSRADIVGVQEVRALPDELAPELCAPRGW